MGDAEEGLYVPPAVAHFFRSQAVPAADILVPNAFELAQLAGRPVESTDDALAAARAVLTAGPSLVVVTSLVPAAAPDTIGILAVGGDTAWHVTTPRLPTTAKGAGDAFAALFLGHFLATRDVPAALADAASSLYAVIEATSAAGDGDLQLVAAQDAMVAPSSRFAAERIDTGRKPMETVAPDPI
jgi:pyridoxine kinase